MFCARHVYQLDIENYTHQKWLLVHSSRLCCVFIYFSFLCGIWSSKYICPADLILWPNIQIKWIPTCVGQFWLQKMTSNPKQIAWQTSAKVFELCPLLKQEHNFFLWQIYMGDIHFGENFSPKVHSMSQKQCICLSFYLLIIHAPTEAAEMFFEWSHKRKLL